MVSIGAQFSTGEQSDSVRERFWASGLRTCQNPSCQSIGDATTEKKSDNKPSWAKVLQSVDHVAGCRMNGDGYGTTVFTCSECGWSTSFQYDEASEPYYYETRFWDPNPKPRPPPHPWSMVRVKPWLLSIDMDPKIIQKCIPFGLMDGPTLSEMGKQQLYALSFTKDEATVLLEAVAQKKQEIARDIVRR
jgi:hypothetical protein